MPIGPGRPLALEKPCQIDIDQAARYFGARQGSVDAATRALLELCAPPLLTAAAPRAVWLESDVAALSAAGILSGTDVMKHLAGCDRAILLAVTLGPGADLQIRRAGVGDIAAGVASDALGSALAEQAAAQGGRRRSRTAPACGRKRQIPDVPLLAGLWRLAHFRPAAGGGGAGRPAADRPVRHWHRPAAAPQKRDGAAGRQRPPGKRTSGRLRPLCAACPLRIPKER